MKKKAFMLFIMTAALLILAGITVNAASITELKNKFPAGTYWNHPNGGNNPDGYSRTPCSHHYICDYYGGCACNSFSNAIQCHGFGLKLGNDYYGQNPRNWSKIYNLNTLKAGDIVRYNNGSYEHTIWVTAVNGDTITFADCNSDGRCKIRWDQVTSKSFIAGRLIYVLSAPYAAISNDPLLSCWRITAIEGVNLRSGPGTGYATAGALSYSTQFYITERKQADGYIWGKTDGGWVVLNYAEHISGPIPELQVDQVEPIHKDNIAHVRNGYCTIKNVASGKFLNIYAGSDANFTSVCMWSYDDSTDQHFRLDHKGNGQYKLYAYCSNRATNRVVDVNRGTDNPAEGDKVQLWTPDDDMSQLYYVWPVGNDEYVFELASKPGYVITPDGDGAANQDGSQLILQRYTGAAYQKWKLCDNNGHQRVANISYAPGYYTVNTGSLPIVRRNAPDPYAEVISGHDIASGETIYVSQVNDFWGYTDANGIGGWICLDYTKSTVVLDSISIASMPDKTTYFVGEQFDSLGLRIWANYSNGQKEEITSGFDVSCNIDGVGTKQVTVTYKDKSTSFNIDVSNIVADQISIHENGLKKIYNIGEELDKTGLSLLVEYNNGQITVIDSGYGVQYDFSTPGTKLVTVTYGGQSTAYEVTVQGEESAKEADIKISSTECEAGNNTAVYVSLKGNGIYDGNMTIQYDASKLKINNVKTLDALKDKTVSINKEYANDKIRVSFSGTDVIPSDSDILKLEFSVLDGTEGTADISIAEAKLYDIAANSIDLNITNGVANVYPSVSNFEITNIQSETSDGMKIVTANVNNDNVTCSLAVYDENGTLIECDIKQPENGQVRLSVKEGQRTDFMVWSKLMRPLMNAITIY